ncbi:UDP-2,3-diacylglucosamine diphosphatase LpxI [Candidatus Poribacteria bacterium]|nr:UDP-2,3-diacylglucosamine diphosphatase LpxI [Candidatus Poribacteria bacterium]
MIQTNETIGLIAGEGTLPLIFIKEAIESNVSVISVAISRSMAKSIEKQGLAKKVHRISLGQIDTIIRTLVNEKIKKVIMLGKVNKSIIFHGLQFDKRTQALIKKLADQQDCSFMQLAIQELELAGLEVINQTEYLTSLLPEQSILTKRQPSASEWDNIRYGLEVAREIARMDIGQTIIVKNCTVVAVEALEGTDNTILRAGKFGGKECVVIKVSRPKQDLRYDIPAIGLNTLKSMKKINAEVLAVEAQKTLLVEKENLIKYADLNNMCIAAENLK